MIIYEDEYLAHYGILRKSGRYPWGSGGPEYANNRDFLGMVEGMRKQGLSEKEIADGLGITTTELRAAKSIAKNEEKQSQITQAQLLKDKGLSNVAIGERMGINESSVRQLLKPGEKDRADILEATSNMLKDEVEKKTYLDVGAGAELYTGVSNTKLAVAVARLKEEGYKLHYVKVQQLGTGKETTLKVLTKPDVPYSEVFKNRDKIRQIANVSEDGGKSYSPIAPPKAVSSKRVGVRYAEEGGATADGVIYVRRGVEDLSLGASNYAQVRISVDGTHYLKGMAMYKDDLPAGVDLLFNTNKSNTGNKLDAMKKQKRLFAEGDDPQTPDKWTGPVDIENPFGASIKRQHGVMNIVNEEGDWDKWSRTLSSQFLSKQSPSLAKSQLAMTQENKQRELDEILALNNPTVKKKLLESFADDADSAAVHLKAAGLPRTSNHVILPISSMKETEIYAPNFKNGERVVLIRHPHGGIFEIPELTVNNNNREAKSSIGNAKDAVGIHHKVAEILSGADFDGDTVLIIPNPHGKVKTANPLDGLKTFDAKKTYKAYEGMPKMSPRTKQIEMGIVSNLITDMTIRGATHAELARAVRHSMVVIDAEKHHLNYQESARRNGIAELKSKYQGGAKAGASTLISRASSEARVNERKQGYKVDPVTGEKIFTETGNTYINKQGKLVRKTQKSTKLAEVSNAHDLSSGTPIEKVYADHSNKLKSLANQARLAATKTRSIPLSPSAKTAYANEVASLNAKLNIALQNAPLERQAQILANAEYSQKRAANPNMEASEQKKVKAQALAKARARTGAKKIRVEITDAEWDAIQAGAISASKLERILANADLDAVKERATPRERKQMTPTKRARAKAMIDSGYTQAEVAAALGVSVTTLKTSIGSEG